ncbi:MAG: IS701 family transposase [Deltaproteobacteria bacterium]|nr:IS701 family transposase [Deltaproteobacteria bacterium]
MDTNLDLDALCSDLPTFSWWLFDGCMHQARTRVHLGTCVEARLHDIRRKTHQPCGLQLAQTEADADALRQRINRGYLAEWDDGAVRERLYGVASAAITAGFALIIDDTGIEKKGTKSPGVQRQYTGTAGKVTNCQIIVSTHLASHDASAALEMDLYLPRVWCEDRERCQEAGIPDEVAFRTKPEIALAQVRRILDSGVGASVVLADAGYGDDTSFRAGIAAKGLHYAVGVSGTVKVWRAGEGPDPPKPRSRKGPTPTLRFPGKFQPVEVRDYAKELAAASWAPVDLRPGAKNPRTSRFAAVRVRSAHRAVAGRAPGDEEWLIIEWPADEDAPTHYFLSNLPADTPLAELAITAKLRWRVERDYQDGKQQVGLDHYEGRTWTGFNHHLTICMAAMTFLVTSQALFPPQPAAESRQRPPAAPSAPAGPARLLSAL